VTSDEQRPATRSILLRCLIVFLLAAMIACCGDAVVAWDRANTSSTTDGPAR
jgi:hypothetical protein